MISKHCICVPDEDSCEWGPTQAQANLEHDQSFVCWDGGGPVMKLCGSFKKKKKPYFLKNYLKCLFVFKIFLDSQSQH